MNGPDFVADTNIIVYLIEGNKRLLPFLEYKYAISVISEIELLGWPGIKPAEITVIKGVIENCLVTELSIEIRQLAIALKQANNIKVPDALIAATSIHFGIPLLTADKGFRKIKELDLLLLD